MQEYNTIKSKEIRIRDIQNIREEVLGSRWITYTGTSTDNNISILDAILEDDPFSGEKVSLSELGDLARRNMDCPFPKEEWD